MSKKVYIICFLSILSYCFAKAQTFGGDAKGNLHYKNTYVKEPLTAENEFRIKKEKIVSPKSFAEAKKILPFPIWKNHNKEIEMYWRAWELAIANIRIPLSNSGFVSSYIDTAYNGNIFMWDSSFILMFARYGARFFPFQNTLDNFYSKQHPDGFICREIRADGSDCFERFDPVSTGPNLFPWCEMAYFNQFGDLERLHKVFPVLCAYNKWLKLNRTWRNGTYWSSGWGTGMDNMPRVESKYSPIFSHGHMIWADTNLQQIFVDELLLQMGFYIERWQEIEDYEDEAKFLKKYVNDNLWDNKTNFIYDQFASGRLNTTKGVGAYWALMTDVLDSVRTEKIISYLNDTTTFKRKYMVPSLSKDNPKYRDNGRYWQGGIWPGTNYMILEGLWNKGYDKLARQIALNHYQQIFQVYKKTGTFWEYYSPESDDPGFMARKDFVGWTGLIPISEFIEFVLGIRADYPNNCIIWDINLLDENGILRYPYGPNGMIGFVCEKRTDENQNPVLHIKSNISFTLIVKYGQNKAVKIKVENGNKVYKI